MKPELQFLRKGRYKCSKYYGGKSCIERRRHSKSKQQEHKLVRTLRRRELLTEISLNTLDT